LTFTIVDKRDGFPHTTGKRADWSRSGSAFESGRMSMHDYTTDTHVWVQTRSYREAVRRLRRFLKGH
jgi:hypothetical protein